MVKEALLIYPVAGTLWTTEAKQRLWNGLGVTVWVELVKACGNEQGVVDWAAISWLFKFAFGITLSASNLRSSATHNQALEPTARQRQRAARDLVRRIASLDRNISPWFLYTIINHIRHRERARRQVDSNRKKDKGNEVDDTMKQMLAELVEECVERQLEQNVTDNLVLTKDSIRDVIVAEGILTVDNLPNALGEEGVVTVTNLAAALEVEGR